MKSKLKEPNNRNEVKNKQTNNLYPIRGEIFPSLYLRVKNSYIKQSHYAVAFTFFFLPGSEPL